MASSYLLVKCNLMPLYVLVCLFLQLQAKAPVLLIKMLKQGLYTGLAVKKLLYEQVSRKKDRS